MNITLTMLSLKLSGLKSYEKHLLTTLCIRADEKTFECWPSIKCLSVDTGLNRKTVQAGLVALIERGYIIRTGEMKGKTKSVPVLRVIFGSDPVYGAALKLSDPVYSISDPIYGTAKRSRIRDMEGYSFKDTKKDDFSLSKTTTQEQKTQNMKWHNYVKTIESDRKLGLPSGNVEILSEKEWLLRNLDK